MRREINLQTGEVTIDADWTNTDIPPPETPEEKTARIESEVDGALMTSPKDKALVRVLADLLRAQQPALTVVEARTAIRQSFRDHYANIIG